MNNEADVCHSTPGGGAVDAVGHPPGDHDGDAGRDPDDFAEFQFDLTGPNG